MAPGRPGDAQQRPAGDQLLRAGRQGRQHRHHPEGGGAGQQQPAAADPVPQGAHGDQEPGDHEPVDVGDPQQLRAGWLQLRAERRHRQVQHRQVHGIQQTRQGQHRQPDPLPPTSPRDSSGGHVGILVCGVHQRFSLTLSRSRSELVGIPWPILSAGSDSEASEPAQRGSRAPGGSLARVSAGDRRHPFGTAGRRVGFGEQPDAVVEVAPAVRQAKRSTRFSIWCYGLSAAKRPTCRQTRGLAPEVRTRDHIATMRRGTAVDGSLTRSNDMAIDQDQRDADLLGYRRCGTGPLLR